MHLAGSWFRQKINIHSTSASGRNNYAHSHKISALFLRVTSARGTAERSPSPFIDHTNSAKSYSRLHKKTNNKISTIHQRERGPKGHGYIYVTKADMADAQTYIKSDAG